MMWSYADVHIYLTIPIIIIEYLLVRPFFNIYEFFKLSFICICALIYTSPWDNYIVYHNAWTYPPERVLGTIGLVPYEEYAFFIIQTVLTALWTIICMRWTIPCFKFNRNPQTYTAIRWIPIALFALATVIGALNGSPDAKSFYLASLFWWISPVIIALWYGGGNYFVQRAVPAFFSIAIPSIYLCWVDVFSLREGIWHITEEKSLEIFVVPDLPLEEAVFFHIVNFLIVLACCAADKAKAVMDLCPDLFPARPSITITNLPNYLKWMLYAFITRECDLPEDYLLDLQASNKVLERGSKSFTAASSAFDTGIRIDLSILYGFARVTDDMIDEEKEMSKKKDNLQLIRKFLDEIFDARQKRTWKYDIAINIDPTRKMKVNWPFYRRELNDEQFRTFRALSRIVYYLPAEPFYELCKGYEWDIDGKEVVSEDDLLEYSSYVASSIGTLCVFIMCYKSGRYSDVLSKRQVAMVERAREMGQVLQIVNIARDIVTDSKTLGRCYVPSEYMENAKNELKILKIDRDPWSLGQDRLRKYALRLIDLADSYADKALKGVSMLPSEVQGPVLATTEIYRMIGVFISKNPGYPERAFVGKRKKILIALSCMYANFMHTKKASTGKFHAN